jgi:hypothetical protein
MPLPGELLYYIYLPTGFFAINYFNGAIGQDESGRQGYVGLYDPNTNRHVDGFQNDAVVEVEHSGSDPQGTWSYLAPGSGIVASLGKTVAGKHKIDALLKMGVTLDEIITALQNQTTCTSSNIGHCKPGWLEPYVPYFDVVTVCEPSNSALCPGLNKIPKNMLHTCKYCSVPGITCDFSTPDASIASVKDILNATVTPGLEVDPKINLLPFLANLDSFIFSEATKRGYNSVQFTTEPNNYGGWGFEILFLQPPETLETRLVGGLSLNELSSSYARGKQSGLPVKFEDLPECENAQNTGACLYCSNQPLSEMMNCRDEGGPGSEDPSP